MLGWICWHILKPMDRRTGRSGWSLRRLKRRVWGRNGDSEGLEQLEVTLASYRNQGGVGACWQQELGPWGLEDHPAAGKFPAEL